MTYPTRGAFLDWGTIHFPNDPLTATLANQVYGELQRTGLDSYIRPTRANLGAIIQTFARGIYGFDPGDTSFGQQALTAIRFHFTYQTDPTAARQAVDQNGIINPNAVAEINAVTGTIEGGFEFGVAGELGGFIGNDSFERRAQLIAPWLSKSAELLDVWVDTYAEFGDTLLALEAVRQDPAYDQVFPGNRRADGSVRLDEARYEQNLAEFAVILEQDAGINPDIFADRFVNLIEGDVSPLEFRARVRSRKQALENNTEAFRTEFARLYGLELSDAALLAGTLDPSLGDDILNQRVAVAEIAAEASTRGFSNLGLSYVDQLRRSGLDRSGARDVFGRAALTLPGLNRSAQRFDPGDRTFGLEEFTDAAVGLDPTQLRRIGRLGAQEQSLFTQRNIRRDQDRLIGLQER